MKNSFRFLRSQLYSINKGLSKAPLPAISLSNQARFRFYSSGSENKGKGNNSLLIGGLAVLGVGIGYYLYSSDSTKVNATKNSSQPLDYQKVYNRIAQIIDENEDYDDGSYGPVLVRLAWHASGTYDAKSKNGGSCGATMRYEEGKWNANAGLHIARDLLEKVKQEFPQITYSDLWTLAGVAAIQEMQGPIIPWRPGRSDEKPVNERPPDGRLPDASQGAQHIRDVFYRMGFDDQETVALIGAHALGRCHTDRSGYKGPWTFSPTVFTNDFFVKLLEEKWVPKKWNGPLQYEDKNSQSLMMLPTDMELVKDSKFRKYVELYAKDQDRFFKDFAKAFSKLLELGFIFDASTKSLEFKPVNA